MTPTYRRTRPLSVRGVSKRRFREKIVHLSGGCAVQHNGWPCPTCFFKIDGIEEGDWWAVLAFRGDYSTTEYQLTPRTWRFVTDIKRNKAGKFLRHVWGEISTAELRRKISAMWARMNKGVH